MIKPIFSYGHPLLKLPGKKLDSNQQEEVMSIIGDMWETMYSSSGVGLAAHQIGLCYQLFVVDTCQFQEDLEIEDGIKKVFINAQILKTEGEFKSSEEGCLSFPDIRGQVERQEIITVQYLDENFEQKKESFKGFNARVIQHEYDHTTGKLFIEKLKPLKRRLIKSKLEKIKKGNIEVKYAMKFNNR